MQNTRLTPAQQAFVDAYLIQPNAVQAYRTAHPGTPYRSAATLSARMLKKVAIRAENRAARRARASRTRIAADRVLREIARIAFFDPLDLFDEQGQLRDLRDVPLEARHAIASVKVKQERVTRRVTRNGHSRTTITTHESVVEYRFCSKVAALGRLADHLGLSTSIPPLEVLLAALPTDVAQELRQLLAGSLSGSGPPSSNPQTDR